MDKFRVSKAFKSALSYFIAICFVFALLGGIVALSCTFLYFTYTVSVLPAALTVIALLGVIFLWIFINEYFDIV